jgi:hypothetical protein
LPWGESNKDQFNRGYYKLKHWTQIVNELLLRRKIQIDHKINDEMFFLYQFLVINCILIYGGISDFILHK